MALASSPDYAPFVQAGAFGSIAKLLFIIVWRRLSLRDFIVKGALQLLMNRYG